MLPETARPPLTVLSEEERMFRDMVRQFAEETLTAKAIEMDRDARFDPALIPQLFELGLMGVEIPDALGGAGASFFTAVLIVEELSRVDPSVAVLVDVQNTLVNNCILRWGSDALKTEYLPRLASDTVGSYALSEAGSGSDAFALKARASELDDGWRLDGQKLWITNGGEAGIFIVFANANPDAGYRGITAFVVERGFPGFSVGKKEDKLGIRASSTVELVLDDCRVPKENVLGEVGKGYKIAIETLNEGRIGI
ncbi:MAG: acyl-CoA dehydrogenase family protein, partial [Gemmatimonadota bacterium]